MLPRSVTVLALSSSMMAAGLAACAQTEPTADPSNDGAATEPAHASSASPTPEPTVSPTSGAAASAALDPYCTPAQAGAAAMNELLEATDRKSEQTGVEDDRGDVALMNAAGDEMRNASATVQSEWADAKSLVLEEVGPDADGGRAASDADSAFEAVLHYLEELVDPEAEIAATAGSIAEYDTATVALLTSRDVIATASAGAQGLSVVLSYTQDRCGALDG